MKNDNSVYKQFKSQGAKQARPALHTREQMLYTEVFIAIWRPWFYSQLFFTAMYRFMGAAMLDLDCCAEFCLAWPFPRMYNNSVHTYIYNALINALSAHIIHINLNTIFYTHAEDSPTKTIYIMHYMETHNHTHSLSLAYTHTHTCIHAQWL